MIMKEILKMKQMDQTNSSDNLDNTNDDLYEHYKFVADKGQQPLRVDKYLMNKVENATRNKIQKAAKDGNILCK
jgi:23S rRNA pseudouridine1911/1915/1917 synthase